VPVYSLPGSDFFRHLEFLSADFDNTVLLLGFLDFTDIEFQISYGIKTTISLFLASNLHRFPWFNN